MSEFKLTSEEEKGRVASGDEIRDLCDRLLLAITHLTERCEDLERRLTALGMDPRPPHTSEELCSRNS